jgi:outer membrane usher protein FimD/PapC
VVNETSRTIAAPANADEPVRTEFHISQPTGLPPGKYHVVVMLNGTKAGEKDFEVK